MNSELMDQTIEYVRTLQRLGQRDVLLKKETIEKLNEVKATAKRIAPDNPVLHEKNASVNLNQDSQAPMAPQKDSPTPVPLAKRDVNMFAEKIIQISGDKEKDMETLREKVMPCRKCPHLVKTRKNVVFGVGNVHAQIMFVGEAPGADEDEQGEPFVGRAGQLLTKMIEAMGLKRQDVYIGNILKCRPDMPAGSTGNRKPTLKEMETCFSYLHTQVQIIQPKALVALGATAMEGLLGKIKVPMGRLRGVWHEFEGIPLMPTYHPAYLLRNQSVSQKRIVWEDLLAVMERVGMPISQKQQNYFLSKMR